MSARLRVWFALVFALLLATGALAKPPTPLLWKATKGDSTVYLLGSLHILLASDYPLSDDVQGAYRSAAQVVFEVPPAEMNPLAMLGPTAKLGMYSDPAESLETDLGPELWQRLLAYGEKNGLSAFALKRMRPWLASLTILAVETKKLSYDPNSGLDKHFMDQAAADHKATGGFESAQQQLQILAGTPRAEQIADLKQMLDDLPRFSQKMAQMHTIWRDGNAAALYAEEIKEFKGQPDMQRRMLDDRNRDWVPKLDKIAASTKGPVLVIVGAMHLLGPDGLVQLLKQDGYHVERVCTGCVGAR